MTKDEALKMALKYIEQNRGENRLEWGDIMLTIRRALAEPDMGIDRGAWADVPDATKWVDELRGGDETEQEPATFESVYEIIIHWDEGGGKRSRRELARRITELYTAPPKREWVELTETERTNLEILMIGQIQVTGLNVKGISNAIRAVEQVLKEKNHD